MSKLLRHTPVEITERQALSINPAKTCQPIGAMYASLGIHGCLPHSHGSQGCCAYHRSTLTRHYKEPISAGTSSFTEGSSVFGGQSNLLAAIQNMFTVYEPEVIAVHTTCLSETIGDDVPQIVDKADKEGKIPAGKHVISASTPSYVGSHVTGFANMVKGMIKGLAQPKTKPNGKVNILPGYVEPADMAEVKRLARMMGVKTICIPDTSGVTNGPLTGEFKMYPDGGVTVAELQDCSNSKGTIAMGFWASADGARYLDTEYKVPCSILELPIGLGCTDAYVDALRTIAGAAVPKEIEFERGQLVDMISDYHQYFYRKKVALVGDPDQLIALTDFLVSLDMLPIHIVTGTPAGKRFTSKIEEITRDIGYKVNVREAGDMFLFHQWIKQDTPDLIIGNTYAKYIARDEDIPLVRHGFPIVDRVGHQYFPTTGYRGGMRLIEKIVDALLSRKERDAPVETFELVF
ncbi:MAG: nitrogenase molybdenum-iron protein subunit beta [Desulfovibrio sp.]|nr:nitrogenase molybdenum-iron protein subunit beta [Desulfovibrio sp.]MCA1985726.1 nitrogenase molybdenum-iron protein subunit beta [Desulfovibrio sp.]